MVGAERLSGRLLVRVPGEHGDLARRDELAKGGDAGEADDAGADHEHRWPVGRWAPQDGVNGDRERLGKNGRAVVDGIGHGVQLRRVGDELITPPPAETRGEAVAEAVGEHAAAEPVAARRGARSAHRTQLEAAGGTGEGGVDRDPGARRERSVGSGLDDDPAHLVAHLHREPHEGPEDAAARAVGEHVVQVAAADASEADRDARPGRPR
jgi:hypothetical protein